MRKLLILSSLVLVLAFYLSPVFAQVVDASPVASPVAAAAAQTIQAAQRVPVVAPQAQQVLVGGGLIAMIVLIVSCLNIILSAVQQIFAKLSKAEPGWLQSVSSVVLAVAKYLGSNPNV